jgi:hypothetical protein
MGAPPQAWAGFNDIGMLMVEWDVGEGKSILLLISPDGEAMMSVREPGGSYGRDIQPVPFNGSWPAALQALVPGGE